MKSVMSSGSSVNICGGSYSEAAYNVPVVADTPHTSDSVVVSFQTNIKTDPCTKSLGIDNVAVYVK